MCLLIRVLVLVSVANNQSWCAPAIFHIANIQIENVRVSCEVAEPEFFSCTLNTSEVSREIDACAPDTAPAFFPRYVFECVLASALAEGSAFFRVFCKKHFFFYNNPSPWTRDPRARRWDPGDLAR